MKVACSSQSFDSFLLNGTMSLRDFYEYCGTIDFIRGVELEDKHIERPEDPHYLNGIRELSATFRLPVVNLAFDCNFGYSSMEKLNGELRRVADWAEVAKKLNIPRFRLFAGWPDTDKERQWPRMVQFLTKAAEIVRSKGLTVVVENHNHGGFLSGSDDVVRLFGEAGDCFRLLLDTGNFTDGLNGILKTAKWAGHVHAKVQEIDSDGRPVNIDYPETIKQLSAAGYDGWLSIEYEGTCDPKQVVYSFGRFLNDLLQQISR